jgi:hypothetical protein
LEATNKKVYDLEKELVAVKKENEALFSKIADLSKEASEKLDLAKNFEHKNRTAEKETNFKLKELKQKNRDKITELQKKYDEMLHEKLT